MARAIRHSHTDVQPARAPMSFNKRPTRARPLPPSTKHPAVPTDSPHSQTDRPEPRARRLSVSRFVSRAASHRRNARRFNSTPSAPESDGAGGWFLTPALAVNPTLQFLVRAVALARRCKSWLLAVHTAASRSCQWRSVGVVEHAPSVLSVPCTPEEIGTRLLRLCVYEKVKGEVKREIGLCIVRVASIVAGCEKYGVGECYQAQLQSEAIGGRECGLIQLAGAPGYNGGYPLSVTVTAGISMQKEVRAGFMEVWKVAGRRGMLVCERQGMSHGFDRVEIARTVLWFGHPGDKELKLKLLFQRRWWRKRFVMGSVELGMAQLARLREGDLVKMRWKESPAGVEGVRFVVVDRILWGERGVDMELRLSR
ncbi:hypothetical protein BWQ96_01459 [Gracilariopsis chorda]|uniref:Uncharacterized protein n=1 Tax=Gracilariopsis chorda TaxID=448386 RepID=A0A2V3J3N8_9FLOR|nr:hypothetical protein BWQ96_01459 [Gracilariopsis chorda]|eukprot:PXF48607.1 hypothetical protein BWQ96_01459 [Gracilariopsis chorda]